MYLPHRLQLFVPGTSTVDGDGNVTNTPDDWTDLCDCRCDDNGAQKQIGINGEGYIFNYHIVFAKREKLTVGTKVKALNEDDTVRGEGEVKKAGETNMLNYSEIYL